MNPDEFDCEIDDKERSEYDEWLEVDNANRYQEWKSEF